jgi:hypothetical protein
MQLSFTAGAPTDEEVAAVVAVLSGIAAATPVSSVEERTPVWARAARYEATGQHAPFTSARDPRLH